MKVSLLFVLETVEFRIVIFLIFTETIRERNNPNAKLKTVSVETKEILAELDRDYKPKENSEKDNASEKADKFNAVCILVKTKRIFLFFE